MFNNNLVKLVVGSRSLSNITKADFDSLIDYHPSDIIVVGACNYGVDALVMKYYPDCIKFPANWQKYGRSAGFVRNRQMHKFIAKFPNRVCYAIWDGVSKGTAHSFDLAKEFGNSIKIIKL